MDETSKETEKLIERIKKTYKVNSLDELTDLQWREISGFEPKWEKVLTPEFIDTYFDKLYTIQICDSQVLNEFLIDKYADRLFWDFISQNQKITLNIALKHTEKLNPLALFNNIDADKKIYKHPKTLSYLLKMSEELYEPLGEINETMDYLFNVFSNIEISNIDDILNFKNTPAAEYISGFEPAAGGLIKRIENVLTDKTQWKKFLQEKKESLKKKGLSEAAVKPLLQSYLADVSEFLGKADMHDTLKKMEKALSIKEDIPSL